MRICKLLLVLSLFSLVAVAASHSHRGLSYDMGEFLENRGLQVQLDPDGRPILVFDARFTMAIPKAGDPNHEAARKLSQEAYLVKDVWGNEFIATFLSPSQLREKIAVHQTLTVMEIAHIPGYITFVSRGENGFPTVAQARAYFRDHHLVGKIGLDHQPVAVLLQPYLSRAIHLPPKPPTRVDNLARKTQLAILQYLIGALSITSTNYDDYGTLVLDINGLFFEIPNLPHGQGTFNSFLWDKRARIKRIPTDELTTLSAGEVQLFVKRMNRFFNLVEGYAETTSTQTPRFERLFRPYSQSSMLNDVHRSWGPDAYLRHLLQSAKEVRERSEVFFRDVIRHEFKGHKQVEGRQQFNQLPVIFGEQAAVPSTSIVAPAFELQAGEVDAIPTFSQALATPKRALFSYALLLDEQKQTWLKKWGRQSKSPIEELLHTSHDDNSMMLLASRMDPADHYSGEQVEFQAWLNHKALSTLLVYPVDPRVDLAVKAARQIAKTADLHLMDPRIFGVNLTWENFDLILARAKELKAKRVLILDFPYVPPAQFARFLSEGVELDFLTGRSSIWQANKSVRSGTEHLLLRVYRYAPTASDRYRIHLSSASTAGMARSGFTQGTSLRLLLNSEILSMEAKLAYLQIKAEYQDSDPVYVFPSYRGNHETASLPFALASHPNPPTILFCGKNRFHVMGPTELIGILIRHFFPSVKSPTDHFHWRGDAVTSTFTVKLTSESGLNHASTEATIRRIITQYRDSAPCWINVLEGRDGFTLSAGDLPESIGKIDE